MNDPLAKIETGAKAEAKNASDQPDPLSMGEKRAAEKQKKGIIAGVRADQAEERIREVLSNRILSLEAELKAKDHLPAEVARLQQCVDAFYAIGWAHIFGTALGTICVGLSGVTSNDSWKWVLFAMGTVSLVLTDVYRYAAQLGLPSKQGQVTSPPA